MAQVGREQLLDFLTGAADEGQPTSIEEIRSGIAPDPGRVIAIWRAVGSSKRSPMPQVIVGDQETIGDLLAWSATYLRGLGPLTAQARVLTPDELQAALQLQPYCNWWQIAGAAAGLVVGEVLTNARRFALPVEVSVAAARSTLSFVLMRATAIGVSTAAFPALSNAWVALRRQSGQMDTALPAQTVEEVSHTLVEATSEANKSNQNPSPKECWFQFMKSRADLLGALKAVSEFNELRLLSNLVVKEKDLTAEERVIKFDEIVPRFMKDTKIEDSEKSFGIAVAAFWCHGSFSQQLSLVRQFMPKAPETVLWLGAMQVSVPISESLAIGEGLGWRLAREMSQADDLFSSPRSDFALPELDFVLNGKSMARTAKLLERTRLDVEIFPGISSYIRSAEGVSPKQRELPIEHVAPRDYGRSSEMGTPKQQELPIEHVAPRDDDQLANLEPLAAAEQSIERALRFIRSARVKEDKRRSSKRRKRK